MPWKNFLLKSILHIVPHKIQVVSIYLKRLLNLDHCFCFIDSHSRLLFGIAWLNTLTKERIATGSGLSYGIVNIHVVSGRKNITFLITGLRSYLKFAVPSQGMSSCHQITQMTKTCRICTQTFLLMFLQIWTMPTTHKKDGSITF